MKNRESITQARQNIANLIIDILAEKITVQEAIKSYPQGIKDESAECAFHAILHYEADEDYRKHDPDYFEEQKNYLEYIANLFRQDEDLPSNIIDEYRKYYETPPLMSKKGIMYTIKSLFRLIH